MLLSPKGRVFLMNHEGVRTKAYLDPINVLTIGAGFTWRSAAFRKWWSQNRPGQAFTIKSTMTPYEIQEALGFMVQEEYGSAVVKWLGGQKVPEHVMDALISVVWNCGAKALSWKWAQAVKRGDYILASKLLKTTAITAGGKRLRGLIRRREEEALLLRMGVYTGVPAGREWQERNSKPQPLASIPNAPVPSQGGFWSRFIGWWKGN